MCKCLYCYKELEEGQKDFHPRCARKFFGTKDVPLLEYKHEELDQLAEQVIRAQTSLTGVQPKLSLNLDKHDGCSRLTIVAEAVFTSVFGKHSGENALAIYGCLSHSVFFVAVSS